MSRHLGTPDTTDVGRRSLPSGMVAIASNVTQMVIGISTTLVLVRLIEPSDYGVYWMGAAVLLLSVSLRDLGIGVAVVNAESLSQQRASGMFWGAALMTLVVGLLIACSGPLLAWFYDKPQLVALMPVLGAASFFSGLGAVHDALLKRRMRFVAVACRDIGGMLAGAIAAITIASAGHGYWALAAQQLALVATGLVVAFAACPWVPAGVGALKRTLQSDEERGHLWHGTRVSITRLIGMVGNTADRVAVGVVAGDRSLGLYNQSYQWAEFPTRQVYQPLMGVVISVFSRKQSDETEQYRRSFRQVLLVLYGVTIPMLVYGAMRGELVIPVLLGEKWIEAAPMFRVLCAGFAFRLVVQASRWLYLGESRSADNLRWTLALTPLLVVSISIGALFGAMGVALGVAIAYVLAAPFAAWYCTRNSRVETSDLITPAVRPLLGSAIGVTVVVGFEAATPGTMPDAARLVAEVAAFILSGGVAWLLPGRGREELLASVRKLSRRFDPADGQSPENPQ